jgi:hypothetical protein
MTFIGSVHNPKIMFCVLIEVLCGDWIAARRRLPREGNVTFKDLMRGAPDLDIRTVTIVGLISVRYLLPITVGIVTVLRACGRLVCRGLMTPVALMGKLDRYSIRAYWNTSAVAESDDVAPLFCTAPNLFASTR